MIADDELLKLNFKYLIQNNKKKELQTLVKSLGEKKIWRLNRKSKDFKKTDLVNIILNNPNYCLKTKKEINKINYDKKIEYYKKLPKRLYSKCILTKNNNYDKPCLNYKKSKSLINYPQIQVCGKSEMIHRLSYALSKNIFVDDIPKYNKLNEKLEICHGHGCNRTCIEPTHLELKTKIENMYNDKVRDGTLTNGQKYHNSKISEELAKQIKWSKGDGRTQKERAKDFNVSLSIIYNIDYNNAWTHIPDKEGNIINSDEKRKKVRIRKELNKEKKITKEDYNYALEKIKNNCDLVVLEENEHLTPCWLYKNYFYDYGTICFKGIKFQSHILAYEAVYGKRDLSGNKKYICHKCNIKACCNPEHLYFGTHSENMIDAVKNNHKGVKLTKEKVLKIRKLLEKGNLTQIEIGKKYNISNQNISEIKNKKIWKHV